MAYQAPRADTKCLKNRFPGATPWQLSPQALFARRRNVYVNTLVAAENTTTKNEESNHHDDHKDHQDGHYSSTAATTIVSHTFILLFKWLPGGRFTTE